MWSLSGLRYRSQLHGKICSVMFPFIPTKWVDCRHKAEGQAEPNVAQLLWIDGLDSLFWRLSCGKDEERTLIMRDALQKLQGGKDCRWGHVFFHLTLRFNVTHVLACCTTATDARVTLSTLILVAAAGYAFVILKNTKTVLCK